MAADNMKKDALIKRVSELRKEHPTLEERLDRYRDRRDAYEAKRMSSRTEAGGAPARPRTRRGREFRG
jgi:hypothetical protein